MSDKLSQRCPESVANLPFAYRQQMMTTSDEEGQFYRMHHDYVDHERDRVEGPRILTVFLYLNTVEEGGETRFQWFESNNSEKKSLRIQPQLGRAVIWPNVLNEYPLERDDRTEHEAMPVIKGRKFAANVWIHLRSIVMAVERGC